MIDITRANDDKIVKANVERLLSRHELGMVKYGVSMEHNNLSPVEWIDHAIEEALDLANYLEKLKQTLTTNTLCDKDGY